MAPRLTLRGVPWWPLPSTLTSSLSSSFSSRAEAEVLVTTVEQRGGQQRAGQLVGEKVLQDALCGAALVVRNAHRTPGRSLFFAVSLGGDDNSLVVRVDVSNEAEHTVRQRQSAGLLLKHRARGQATRSSRRKLHANRRDREWSSSSPVVALSSSTPIVHPARSATHRAHCAAWSRLPFLTACGRARWTTAIS